MTVSEKNKFGEMMLGGKWIELTISVFKIFLSLLLHTGTIKCPIIKNLGLQKVPKGGDPTFLDSYLMIHFCLGV